MTTLYEVIVIGPFWALVTAWIAGLLVPVVDEVQPRRAKEMSVLVGGVLATLVVWWVVNMGQADGEAPDWPDQIIDGEADPACGPSGAPASP